MTLQLGKIRVKIHGVLPLLWLFAWITGRGSALLPTFLALLIHESGHLLAANCLKMPVECVEITPYGGVISMEQADTAPPLSGFLLAAAGPAFSLAGCLLSLLLLRYQRVDFDFLQKFFRGNLLLLLLNLFPALPLDGGRMCRALLRRFLSHARATQILTAAGNILGLLLCLLSLLYALHGKLNLSPAFAGLYLIYAAAQESRQATARYISALIARRQRMEKGKTLPVEIIAACGNMPLHALPGKMNTGRYHQILIMAEDGMEPLGVIHEQTFCSGLLQAPDAALKTLLKKE